MKNVISNSNSDPFGRDKWRSVQRVGAVGLHIRPRRHRSTTGQRGTSLLECATALALAAVVLVSTTSVSQASATLVRRARVLADTVDLARNLLEHELGAPCAAPLECPAGYRCSVTRAPVTAVADRLTASVARDDGEAAEELRTLAPAPSCGS